MYDLRKKQVFHNKKTNIVKVCYSQKTEQPIKKLELIQWRKHFQEKITQNYQDMSDNWNMCDLVERIKIEEEELKNIDEITPATSLLGYGFSVTIQNADNDIAIEIIEKIEKLSTILRN